TTRRYQAVMLPVNGGPLQFLENLPSNGGPLRGGTGWLFSDTRNGVRGLFLKPPPEGPDRLLFDGGQESVFGLAVSRDSRTIAAIRGRITSDALLIRAK